MNQPFTCGFQGAPGPWEFRGNQLQPPQDFSQHQYQQQNQLFFNQPCNQNTYTNNFQQLRNDIPSPCPNQIWNTFEPFNQNGFQNYEHKNVQQQQQQQQQHVHNQNQFPAWPFQHSDVRNNAQYGHPMYTQGRFDHGEKWSSQDATSSQLPPTWNLPHTPAWQKPQPPAWKKPHPPVTKQLFPPAWKPFSRTSSLVSINNKEDRAIMPKEDSNNKHSSKSEASERPVNVSKGDNKSGETLTVLTNDRTDARNELSNESVSPNNCNILKKSSKSSDDVTTEFHTAIKDSQFVSSDSEKLSIDSQEVSSDSQKLSINSQDLSSDSLQLKEISKSSGRKSDVLKRPKEVFEDKLHIDGTITNPTREPENLIKTNRLVLHDSKDSLENRSEVLDESYNTNDISKELNVLKDLPHRNENDVVKESHEVSKYCIGNPSDSLNKPDKISKHLLDICPVLKEPSKFASLESQNKTCILKESDVSKESGESSIKFLNEGNEAVKASHKNKALKVRDKTFKELLENQNEILKESSKTSTTVLETDHFVKEATMSHIEKFQYSSNTKTSIRTNLSRESDATNKKTHENCIDKFRHSSKNKNGLSKSSAKHKYEVFMHEKKKSDIKNTERKRKDMNDLRRLKRKASDESGKYNHKRVKQFKNKANLVACRSDIDTSSAVDHRDAARQPSPNSSTVLKSTVKSDDRILEETHENNSELHKYSSKKRNEATGGASSTTGNNTPKKNAQTSSRELKLDLTRSPKSENTEIVTQSLTSKFREQPLMTTDIFARHSSPCSSKEIICYTCKNVVKEYQLSSHLFFGSVKCRDCCREITSCRSFREMRRATDAKKGSTCLHRSLKWLNNPFSYIKNKLQKKLRKIKLKGKLTEEDLLIGVSAFARRLRALEHKSPWRSAIEKLRRSLESGIPPEYLTKVEKNCNLASCDSARIETKPEGYDTYFSDKRNASCKSHGEERENDQIQKENPKHTMSMPPSPSVLLDNALEDMNNLSSVEKQKASEPSLVDSERIPQIVEEEVIIPQTMWEDDIISFGGVEQVDENIISVCACEDSSKLRGVVKDGTVVLQAPGHTSLIVNADELRSAKAKLEEQAVSGEQNISEEYEFAYGSLNEFIPKGVSKMTLITQQSLTLPEETGKVTFSTEEVRMSKMVQEIKKAPEFGETHFQSDMSKAEIIPKKVEAKPVKSIAKQECDEIHNMKLDITQAEQEEIREKTLITKKPASRNSNHAKKSCKMNVQDEEESQIIKKYNLRRHRHQPFISFLQRLKKQYKNGELWTHILPAVKAFHEHSSREEDGDSFDLTLNYEEADDEFMMDILLSQAYGLQHMNEIADVMSKKDRNIVSQIENAIKNSSMFVNKPDFIPSHVTRSSSRAGLKSYSKRKIVQEKTTSPKAHLDPMVFGKDIPQNKSSKIHIVTPPPDGFYYVATYPTEPCPTECPMCYYRIFPSMFALNLVTNLATARCFGCPLTIYIVQEPVNTSLPKIVFESNKREDTVVTEKPYKPKPARFKVTVNKSKKRRRRLSIHQFIKK
ncbi:inner centromere protein A [Procambarus clarkii]|uniref:inner centromere protein A n=1 Tax=Procambarus clarkii TaxID=6728 RepID=UPI00374264A8